MCDRITTNSVWAETKTFFPLFFDYLEKQNKQISVKSLYFL